MDLSQEDNFRLNVLLASNPQAIRIDESAMVVYALTEKGEAKVALNPTCRDERYLKSVRELLSGHVTGSPGGYPVFLKRWTRMGQMREESLEQLLLLGEPEAVVAAVCSPGIGNELARRAWWAMQDADNARRMLTSPDVVRGDMGPILAEFLMEFLPFETETEKMMESVRLLLQPGLTSEGDRLELWKKSGRKQAYLVGFMMAIPDDLPEASHPHPDFPRLTGNIAPLAERGNAVASSLLRALSAPGQAYFGTLGNVLKKPPTQDVVTAALDTTRHYCKALRPGEDPDLTLEELLQEADRYVGDQADEQVSACVAAMPEAKDTIRSLRVMSGLGYGVVRPIFRKTTAIGSLMRRKLEPVVQALMREIAILNPKPGG